jgi:hypothetical protein
MAELQRLSLADVAASIHAIDTVVMPNNQVFL